MVRIHYLQHVEFEGLGCIENWVTKKGYPLSATKFYQNPQLPDQSAFDWLIIMGGPMGVNDYEKYNWLKEEKEFINLTINQGKTVIGICLGAQLIASVLGARVYPNQKKEIGWFPITLSQHSNNPLVINETTFTVFHWHGDTFDLPDNSVLLASNNCCLNQAFIYKNNVVGIQFHLEVTENSLSQMVSWGKEELVKEEYVQNQQAILNEKSFIQTNNYKMYQLLDYLEQNSSLK